MKLNKFILKGDKKKTENRTITIAKNKTAIKKIQNEKYVTNININGENNTFCHRQQKIK